MQGFERAAGIFLILGLLTSFLLSSLFFANPVYATPDVDNYEEFEDNVIFYDEKFNFPTLFDNSSTWDLGSMGQIHFRAYASLGKFFVQLPATIKARYDTTLETNEANSVQMLIEPYDGDGYEFEFIFGFYMDLTYEKSVLEVDLGQIGWGLNWEADFAAPLNGESHRTSSVGIDLYTVGVKKVLDVTFGLNVAWNIYGFDVNGTYWLDDAYAEILDENEANVSLLSDYGGQFKIYEDEIVTNDDYVDFGVNNLQYNIAYGITVQPYIELNLVQVAGFSRYIPPLRIEPDVWIPLPFQIPDAIPLDPDKSDDLHYQMSRSINAGGSTGGDPEEDPFFPPYTGFYNLPIFDIGPLGSINMTLGEACPVIEVPLRIISYTEGWQINGTVPTILSIYFANGTLMKTVSITQSDFDSGYKAVTIICNMTERTPYQPIKFVLSVPPPNLPVPGIPLPQIPEYLPYLNKTATLLLTYLHADLIVSKFEIRPYAINPFTALRYVFAQAPTVQLVWLEITGGIKNVGRVSSAPANVKLWVWEGYPPKVTVENVSVLLPQATLVGQKAIGNVLPRQSAIVTFNWLVTPYWENKNATFILYVDYENTAPENIERENNVGWTTFFIANTSTGMKWTYQFTNSSFRLLNTVHESISALQTAQEAAEALTNPEAYSDPVLFINTVQSMTQKEYKAASELTGKVSNSTLETYLTTVEELNTTITMSAADGDYTQEEILRVIHLQLEVDSIVDTMWSGSLTGFVFENFTGQPLSGVKVSSEGSPTQQFFTFTDENGFFNFTNLYPGQYNLSLTKFGYQNISQMANVTAEGITNMTIWLTPITGSLEVNVTDHITDQPLAAAMVTISKPFSEGLESGAFAGWDFYYSTNHAQNGSIAPGTWSSSIVSGASALSGSYSARLFADSDAWASPWWVDAAINRTIDRAGASVLRATLKFDDIQGTGGTGISYFAINVFNALNTSKRLLYGFSTTGDYGNIKHTVSPGDLVNFERNIVTDYFDKYNESLPDQIMIRFLAHADYAETNPPGQKRRTTDVRIDDIELPGTIIKLGFTTNGYISFDKLPPGNYTISVEKKYYLPAKTVATICSRTTTSLQMAMTPELRDIAIIDITTSKTVASNLTIVYINVTVENQGNFTANFHVSLYYNMNSIGTQTCLQLTSGNTTTLVFAWNTTGVAKGNYTISAYAWPVPGETDTVDNSMVGGWIFITLSGDVDGDRDVDIFDIVMMAGGYGSKEENPKYDPNSDIDGDGDIDIFDIVAAAGNYGKSW